MAQKQGDKIKEEYGVSEHSIPCRSNEWDLCLIVQPLSPVTEVNQMSWECHVCCCSFIKPLLENFFFQGSLLSPRLSVLLNTTRGLHDSLLGYPIFPTILISNISHV